ncbi:MAG: hypothetical protein RR382_11260, partial [Tannerellaceae bacterium]
EAIWETIIEVVAIVAELFCMDQEQLLSQILPDNRRLRAMRELPKPPKKNTTETLVNKIEKTAYVLMMGGLLYLIPALFTIFFDKFLHNRVA